MFTIRLESAAVGENEVVVVRTARDWDQDLTGDRNGGVWTFTLDEQDHTGGLEFKFVIRPHFWMRENNLRRPAPSDGQTLVFTDADVTFPFRSGVPGDDTVARALLTAPESARYDVIVVGSGMGGGVLASALADLGVGVLVLEAGPLLFPTHVGNLARRLAPGQFRKHVWSLWKDFGVLNYVNTAGSEFVGAAAFNLGGRSVFWGGLIPQLAPWELAAWPATVRDHLRTGGGYARAAQTFNASPPAASTFQAASRSFLQATLPPGWDVRDAPMGIQYRGQTSWSLPTGFFSTADLLLEDTLLDPPAQAGGDRALTVRLQHPALSVRFDANGTRATGVDCFDIEMGARRTFWADRAVVLCAGTIESARIALRSGASDRNARIGRGITDHVIRFKHFMVPPGIHCEPGNSAKFLIQHPNATLDPTSPAHAFDIVVELGNPFNQGRYTHRTHLDAELAAHPGKMQCEIVFQYYSPLLDQNSVTADGDVWPSGSPANVTMGASVPHPDLLAEADAITQAVLAAFAAQPVEGEEGLWPGLQTARLGGVSHEVGTLRMAADGTGVVDEDLKFLDHDHLYACDNSVFPVSPAGNPSLTLAALALRLADHLGKP